MVEIEERPLSTSTRGAWAGLAALLLALLAMAAWLDPSPSGRGTHQQLGLPPCTFLFLFDRPCPACGMTTSWSYVMHGDWDAACRANLGGTLLALLAISVACGALAIAASGRRRWVPGERTWALLALTLAVITLVDWLRRV